MYLLQGSSKEIDGTKMLRLTEWNKPRCEFDAVHKSTESKTWE
jgi:hypothetical protein